MVPMNCRPLRLALDGLRPTIAWQPGYLGDSTSLAFERTMKNQRGPSHHVWRIPGAGDIAAVLVVTSLSDSCVPPARECSSASAPSLRAGRGDVRVGSIPSLGAGTKVA